MNSRITTAGLFLDVCTWSMWLFVHIFGVCVLLTVSLRIFPPSGTSKQQQIKLKNMNVSKFFPVRIWSWSSRNETLSVELKFLQPPRNQQIGPLLRIPQSSAEVRPGQCGIWSTNNANFWQWKYKLSQDPKHHTQTRSPTRDYVHIISS